MKIDWQVKAVDADGCNIDVLVLTLYTKEKKAHFSLNHLLEGMNGLVLTRAMGCPMLIFSDRQFVRIDQGGAALMELMKSGSKIRTLCLGPVMPFLSVEGLDGYDNLLKDYEKCQTI